MKIYYALRVIQKYEMLKCDLDLSVINQSNTASLL